MEGLERGRKKGRQDLRADKLKGYEAPQWRVEYGSRATISKPGTARSFVPNSGRKQDAHSRVVSVVASTSIRGVKTSHTDATSLASPPHAHATHNNSPFVESREECVGFFVEFRVCRPLRPVSQQPRRGADTTSSERVDLVGHLSAMGYSGRVSPCSKCVALPEHYLYSRNVYNACNSSHEGGKAIIAIFFPSPTIQ